MLVEESQENYQTGWIKIFRSVMKKGWFLKGDYFKLWCYLLMEATHTEKEYFWNGETIKLSPGQFVTGRKKISSETGIPQTTIERILNFFENEHQIGQQKTNTSRLISILNWHLYQTSGQGNGQQMDNKRTTDGQQTDTKQEVQELKEFKNFIIISETDEIWIENMERIHKKTKTEIGDLLRQFSAHLITIQETKKTLRDFKQHFNNWLRKQNNGKPTTKEERIIQALKDF